MKLVDGRVSLTVNETVRLYWMLGQAMEHLDEKRLRLVEHANNGRVLGDEIFARSAFRVARRVSRKFGSVASFRARLSALIKEARR
jgi:hypothetical protein